MNFHYLDLDSHSFQMQRLLLLILPTSFSLLSLPRKPQTFPNSPLVSNDLTQTRTEEDPTQTRTDPPYTCDSILGSSLCPLEEEHKTLEVRGTTLHYWVYQVYNIWYELVFDKKKLTLQQWKMQTLLSASHVFLSCETICLQFFMRPIHVHSQSMPAPENIMILSRNTCGGLEHVLTWKSFHSCHMSVHPWCEEPRHVLAWNCMVLAFHRHCMSPFFLFYFQLVHHFWWSLIWFENLDPRSLNLGQQLRCCFLLR